MIDEHEENRRVTREEYARAFEAWASVANLTDDEQGALAAAIAAFLLPPTMAGRGRSTSTARRPCLCCPVQAACACV